MRVSYKYFILIAGVCLLACRGQVAVAQQDSLVLVTGLEQVPVESYEQSVHSPHKASLFAAILPGMGQVYNQKYWKLPLVYGGIAGIGYAIHFNSKYYKRYRSAYRDFIIRDPNNMSYVQFIPPGLTLEDVHGKNASWFQNALNNKKNYYKRYRDLSYIGMAVLYVAQIIDATVDAHFFDFDISDDLSLRIAPAVTSGPMGNDYPLGMQLQFNF